MQDFVHLHVHTQYSLLDGQASIPKLVDKAIADGQPGMAVTDHGNMMGIKEYFNYVNKKNKKLKEEGKPPFKPIFGCEMYVAERTLYDRDKELDGRRYHLIVLAKNERGYHNLVKLVSKAWVDGFYNRPRTDHNELAAHAEGLIVCSACIAGEVPRKILDGDIAGAEATILWYKSIFGDDYYLELQRHEVRDPNQRANRETYPLQQRANAVIIELARKHGIKVVCTNDVHFVDEENAEAHDRLICLGTARDLNDPTRMLYSKQEWFKTRAEMEAIFPDVPEAMANTLEVLAKVETYSIDHGPIMPNFPIPKSFATEDDYHQRFTGQQLFDEFTHDENGNVVCSPEDAESKVKKLGGVEKLYRLKLEADYLAYLTYEGARKRYGDPLPKDVDDRLRFELHVMKTMGFPGYFLIVQDYINAARYELGVSVGPGRGSAAGSAVAYCLGITQVDPIQYDLLFERFLNPDRISLPDIDVDFDDDGRGKVLSWVTQKYGEANVTHIITYGTMATKSAIADVGRVEKIDLPTVNKLKEYIPDRGFPDNIKDEKGKSPKVNLVNCYKYIPELKHIMEDPGNDELKDMLTYAAELEDTNRQVGIHACGVIIGADDLTNIAPVCTIYDKESKQDVLVTQYDGHVVETVGLIKMDFLGLKNLTIIKNAIQMIKKNHGVEIDIDHIPIDDEATYKLFCEGNTVGTFQFESAGMQKYLRELEPHVFEDLIAMNALYRPGPMDYIPDFIDRKQGRKPIEYDIPCMEKYLKDTYGITVYQEQVMLLSRQLAGFTRGQSDTLRKAMGKKQIEKMNELEVLFYQGGEKNGHPKDKLHKIWEDWKKFASYAFNKSHATCYSWVAYQTAYLKAHYPAEYMAAVMTSGQSDIKRTTELMDDCRRHGLEILPPSINESDMDFSVNSKGQIRFGLKAISGMGEAAADAIISEREKNGPYTDIFDLLERADLRSLNRKNIEALVKAGALDGIGTMHRAQYFYRENDNAPTYVEKLMRWALHNKQNADNAQMSIFDMNEEIKKDSRPAIPQCEEWSVVQRCREEFSVIGLYLSGHPLDDYRYEMTYFTNTQCAELADPSNLLDKDLRIGGIVTDAKNGISSKNGDPYGALTIEDLSGAYNLRLFKGEYLKFKDFFQKDLFIYIKGSYRQFSRTLDDGTVYHSKPVFKVYSITLLREVLDNNTKLLQFYIDLHDITPELCQQIQSLAKKHRGKTPMEAHIVDPASTLTLTMKTRDLLVSPRDMIIDLNRLPGIFNLKPVTHKF